MDYRLDPPEPMIQTYCEVCGEEIYKHEDYYMINHMTICEACVLEGKVYAEYEV